MDYEELDILISPTEESALGPDGLLHSGRRGKWEKGVEVWRVKGDGNRRAEGGENVRASRRACNVFFYQSIQDMAPGIHQLTCRPTAQKTAVSCPAAISLELSIDQQESIRHRKHRKHKREQAVVVLVTHAHTHTLARGPLCFGEGGMERIHGRGRGKRVREREEKHPSSLQGKIWWWWQLLPAPRLPASFVKRSSVLRMV